MREEGLFGSVVLLGPPGVGKTHLAIALGLVAAGRRYSVKFTTAARMISTLVGARGGGSFTRRLSSFCRPRLLIVDEVGFLPLEAEGAALLFEVVARRYERGSIILIILTANKSYGADSSHLGHRFHGQPITDSRQAITVGAMEWQHGGLR